MNFNRKLTVTSAPHITKVQGRVLPVLKGKELPVTELSEYIENFPRNLNQKELITLKKVWSAYELTRKLNFDSCFKNKSYHKFLPGNLNIRYEFYPYYSNFVYRERGATFIPIAAAINKSLRLEVNSFYYKTPKIFWQAIIWHEMAHLIDRYHVSVLCVQKSIIKDSRRVKKMTMPATKAQRSALAYFTQPDKDSVNQSYDWFNLTEEAFAESFATIMLLVTQGINARTVARMQKRIGFICVYHNTLCKLLNEIDFKAMGLRMTPMKKQKILQFFHQTCLHDTSRYIQKTKITSSFRQRSVQS